VNDVSEALKDALAQKNADALIEVSVEYQGNFYFFAGSRKTIVQGKATRFMKQPKSSALLDSRDSDINTLPSPSSRSENEVLKFDHNP